ncbi:RNAseH domain-containing protein [Massilia forsythiae]|uniref:RNAseH domain-containing protein n=1 Tax=Massilia forsythiae TaxID=2728020 RepID=A0A7Z2ZTE7_9BURK|nr:RNaseH domain-containing protein [Massilia forsythiae]QJE01511.1 RNAseH domain-containing protein [Massilia forsythiae]
MRHGQLRTNLFRFTPAALPCAYAYQATRAYQAAWSLLKGSWSRTNLPTSGLAEMLAILSRGPVWINIDPSQERSVPAIVTLHPLPVEVINRALHLWALDTLRVAGAAPTIAADRLEVGAPYALSAEMILGTRSPIASMAYEVIPWLVAAAMSVAPMTSTIPLSLHLTSEGELLAWDHPIVSAFGDRRAVALHGIRPKLVLIHGETTPYIAIRVHLSHILTQWKHKTRHALVRTNGSIAKLAIFTKRHDDGHYETNYLHQADRLLGHFELASFPRLGIDNLSAHSDLRPLHAIAPSAPLIASGAGPLFLDQACWHLRSTVAGTEPVLAERVVGSLRKDTWTGADGSAGTTRAANAAVNAGSLPILVVTAHAQTAMRLDKVNRLIGEHEQRLDALALQRPTLHHTCPPDAEGMLCRPVDARQLEGWFRQHLAPALMDTRARTAIIETSLDAAQGKPELDPKFQLRRLFAESGATSQFIFTDDPEQPDYAASASLLEAIRQAGILRSRTRVRTLPDETVVVCLYLERIRAKGTAVFLPVVTRMRLDDGVPKIFWLDPRTNKSHWLDYQSGITQIHAHSTLMTAEEVRHHVARALLAPTDVADTPLIVFCHSALRSIFDGLRDSGGQYYPDLANTNAWIVRVRADADVAQMSGDNVRHRVAPGYIGARIGLYQASCGRGVYYFVSPSNHYSRVISQRFNTRYDIDGRFLRDPWRQLGVTEIAILRAGRFASESEIAHQAALFCRNSPVWEGTLRLPAPMHLGKQVAHDHPAIGISRRLYAND